MMKPRLNTKTTTGSTFNPGLSSVYNLSIVPELPPAPALLVEVGLAFLTDSLWSAAARLLMADFGPPGGEFARAMLDDVVEDCLEAEPSGPDSGPEVSGDEGLGAACCLPSASTLHSGAFTLFGAGHQILESERGVRHSLALTMLNRIYATRCQTCSAREGARLQVV